jgi:hypothetical protein
MQAIDMHHRWLLVKEDTFRNFYCACMLLTSIHSKIAEGIFTFQLQMCFNFEWLQLHELELIDCFWQYIVGICMASLYNLESCQQMAGYQGIHILKVN